MSEVSFDARPGAPAQEQPTPAAEVVQQNQTTALARVSENRAVAKQEPFKLRDFVPGFKDVILPRCNIVFNTGELAKQFRPGEILYGQSAVLYSPPKVNKMGVQESAGTPPVNITFIGRVSERFVEKVEWGTGQRGIIVADEQSVINCGGTTDYDEYNLRKKDGCRLFEPMHDMLIAIERPACCADDGTLFVFEAGAKKYTFGFWALKGSCYTEALKKVVYLARTMGCLRGDFPDGGFPAWSYSVSTWQKPFKSGNTSPVPRLVPCEKNSPEFLSLIEGFVSRNA